MTKFEIIETTELYTESNYPFMVVVNGLKEDSFGCLSRAVRYVWETYGVEPGDWKVDWTEYKLRMVYEMCGKEDEK